MLVKSCAIVVFNVLSSSQQSPQLNTVRLSPPRYLGYEKRLVFGCESRGIREVGRRWEAGGTRMRDLKL